MRTAIILAAGMGTRLRSEHSDKPKGFVVLGERPIIEESILRLERAGVSEVVIVTGYGAEHYHELERRFDGLVRTVHNPRYADSGSMYSLWCARELVDDDFLLLESDLVYESRALDILTGIDAPDAILLSGSTGAGDEVYVETRNGLLTNMSKDLADLKGTVAGELVGISRVSRGLFALMRHIADEAFRISLNFDYETDAFVAAARNWEIACPVMDDLLWAEIDDPDHLARAQRIYPRISAGG